MNTKIAPWVRVSILLLASTSAAGLSYYFTGTVLPNDPREALIFQNALLLIVLGSALLEHHYTKPADSVVNSLMGTITLLTVYGQAPIWPWRIVTGYCCLVFVLSVICVAVSSSPTTTDWRKVVARLTYRPSVVFGQSRILFSIVFLSGIWFFYSVQDPITLALVIFWGIFIAIWPLRVPELFTSWFQMESPDGPAVGEIVRIDNPNILRVALDGEANWDHMKLKICILPNGKSFWVQPLFSQFQDGRILATGLLTNVASTAKYPQKNCIVDPTLESEIPTPDEINAALGGGARSTLVGFVVEKSAIGAIRFETLSPECCYDGMLVWSDIFGDRVYYQIVSGETAEESFSADKHGFQVATATQLGSLVEGEGFTTFEWLPAMNTPVFSTTLDDVIELSAIAADDFELGKIPRTNITVGGNFAEDYSYHTAILGVTGSGKTELAFDLIRHALTKEIRVICIDLTAQYEGRLEDLNPINLSIEEATATELSEKLFDVDTGQYGAGDEKRALNDFAVTLREQISESIESFLNDEEGSNLGLIRLEEISNTKATLWITEIFMSCLLKYARENQGDCPKILIVVEEAHTVMPEPNTMGLGDFDSRGLVGKISQIALQGRKYGVGLLVLAQRTATVSKTILTQCNTIISFTCYDDTSLGFLRNIFGPEQIALIPNLPRLHAVAFGKWVRSERPFVFEIPFDEDKIQNQA